MWIAREGARVPAESYQKSSHGSWVYLGRYYFDAGSSENNRLTLDAGTDTGYSVADAAWFIYDN